MLDQTVWVEAEIQWLELGQKGLNQSYYSRFGPAGARDKVMSLILLV